MITDPAPRDIIDYEDRREATRFQRQPEDDYATVWVEGEEAQLAEVHDESLHGISLTLAADSGIGVGCEVHIVYAGTVYLARACHAKPCSREKLLIGFRCEPLPQ